MTESPLRLETKSILFRIVSLCIARLSHAFEAVLKTLADRQARWVAAQA
jgi:hypothetical protein